MIPEKDLNSTDPKSRDSRVRGFKTGDLDKAVILTGKKAGTVQGINWKWCRKLHGSSGETGCEPLA